MTKLRLATALKGIEDMPNFDYPKLSNTSLPKFFMKLPCLVDLKICYYNLPSPNENNDVIYNVFSKLEKFEPLDLDYEANKSSIAMIQYLQMCTKLQHLSLDWHDPESVDESNLQKISKIVARMNLRSFCGSSFMVQSVLGSLLSWCSLSILKVEGYVKASLFKKICVKCPYLIHLDIQNHETKLKPNEKLSLLLLKSLKELTILNLEVGEITEVNEMESFYQACNSTFPMDQFGDTLNTFPKMKDFSVRSNAYRRFNYVLHRTCLGEVKRYFRFANCTVELKKQDVLTNTIPASRMFCGFKTS